MVKPSKTREIWKSVAETAKEDYGIKIKIKNFTDYNQPNKALQNGDIDLNAFQHYTFLNAWNKANHGSLVAIGNTILLQSDYIQRNIRILMSCHKELQLQFQMMLLMNQELYMY